MKPISKVSQRTFRKRLMSFGFTDKNEANYCVNFIKSRKGVVSRRLFIEVAWWYLQDLNLYQICDRFDWLLVEQEVYRNACSVQFMATKSMKMV